MKCPSCRKAGSKVVESRHLAEGESIRRRRECLRCGFRFTSYEALESASLAVVKRNNRREPFDLKKIERGLASALKKRPVATAQVEAALKRIAEAAAAAAVKGEIESAALGELILDELNALDKVAYVRFASVYRQFDDLDEFVKMIKTMKKRGEK